MLEDRRLLANPGLSIYIVTDSIAANAGPGATTGTVTRTSADTSQPLTVYLRSSAPEAASVPATVVIPAGETWTRFTVDATLGNSRPTDQAVSISGTVTYKGVLNQDRYFYPYSLGFDSARKVATQPDGKILVAGTRRSDTGNATFAIRRFNTDGTPDTSFYNGSVGLVGLSGRSISGQAIAIQPDGKILVGGFFQEQGASGWNMELVRLTPDGLPDSSFGTNGWVSLVPTAGTYNEIWDLAVLPDGKILIGGSISNPGTNNDFAVARLNSSGSLDTSFGSGGYATTSFSNGDDRGYDLAVQSDGKILLAGTSSEGNSTSTFAVVRWTAGGQLDSTFGTGGKVATDVTGNNDRSRGVVIQPDGRIVVVGSSTGGLFLVRYTTTGVLDASFGNGGFATKPSSNTTSVILRDDGTIVTGGVGLARFDANGGDLGLVSNDTVDAMAAQLGDRIVVLGHDTSNYLKIYSESVTAIDTVTVRGVAAPTAVDDAYSPQKSTTLNIAAPGVLANDLNPATASLTAVLVTGPKRGSLSLKADGSFTYTPNGLYLGPDSFTYKTTNGISTSLIATVSLNVVGANDPPIARVDAYDLVVSNQTTQLLVPSRGVLDNDGDPNIEPITAVLDSQPASGHVVLNANGSFVYTPNAGFYGIDYFTYRATDGDLSSAPTTATITVYSTPTALTETYTADKNMPLTVAAPGVLANDTSPTGLPLRAILSVQPKSGTISLSSDGSFIYTPRTGFVGQDSFTYFVTDGRVSSPKTTDVINVVFTDKPPLASDDAYTYRPGEPLIVGTPGLLANDRDPYDQAISAVLVSPPAHGSLTFNSDGSFTYIPAAGWSGPDSFTYKASDGGLESTVAIVRLSVADVSGNLWTQRGGNARHTSYVDAWLDTSGITAAWAQPLTYVASGSWAQSGNQAVAVDDMRVYRTSLDGYWASGDYHIIAYDLTTGAPVWNQILVGNGPVSAPTVVDGKVYVNRSGHSGSLDRPEDEKPWLYVLDARTGAVLQRQTYAAQWDSDERPVVEGGQVVASDGYNGGVSAWTASTLVRLWTNPSPHVEAPLAALDDQYVYAFDNQVYLRSTGADLGKILPPTGRGWIGSPVVSDSGGLLFDVQNPPGVSSYDAQTRMPRWTVSLPVRPVAKAVGKGVVAVVAGTQLILLDERNGAQLGLWNAPETLNSQIVLTRNYAFVESTNITSSSSHIYAINLATWKVDWTYENRTKGYLLGTTMEMAFGGGRLILTNDAFVTAFIVPDATPATALYVGSDATTRGNWDASYGAGGYSLAGSADTLGASFSAGDTAAYTWQSGSSDPRGLEQPQAPGRILAAWYKDAFTVAVDAGATPQKVSLYFVDADGGGRSQRVEVLDATTGAVLDTRVISEFGGGVYLTWTLSGEAKFRITRTGGPNAVLSGVFVGGGFDGGGEQESATASYVGSDATTQGSWDSAYGTGGYALAGSANTLGAAFGTGDTAAYTWQAGGSDPRGLADPLATGRLLAAWYKDAFSVSLDAGATARRVSLYFLDADGGGRSQRVEVLDATTGAVLDTRSVSDFSGGVYLTWTLSGKVSFRITRIGGPNAVLSGVFVDGTHAAAPSATFKGSDATTRGDWASAYGAGGYAIAASGNTLGAAATFGVDAPAYTWQAGSADPRGLADPLASGRLLAAWYKDAFTVTLDAGPSPKQASLYFLDADGGGRSQRVEVLDAATGAVLDARDVSDFSGGVYLTWTLSGKVAFRITRIGGPNAVLSGLFLG